MTRPTTDAQRAAKRELENRRSIERGRALNEIAPIPECEDVDLRNELERNPSRWLSTLLPEVFYSAFTATQERFIELVWQAIVEGSWRNIEAYRGIGKTSILSGLLLKAFPGILFCGLRRILISFRLFTATKEVLSFSKAGRSPRLWLKPLLLPPSLTLTPRKIFRKLKNS